MALFTWNQNYSVNVVELDQQHKKLIDMLNELHGAMLTGKSKDVLSKILDGLIDYTGYHFTNEEKYMNQYNYPEYQLHKLEHDKLVKQVLDFQSDFRSGKIGISVQIMNFLKEWLMNHILGTDKKYGPFFNEKGLR